MADDTIRWNLEVMKASTNSLGSEREQLETQLGQMRIQQNRVDINWQSPAGLQYQNRLANDVNVLDSIGKQLEKRVESLKKVNDCYAGCEEDIAKALVRLPK